MAKEKIKSPVVTEEGLKKKLEAVELEQSTACLNEIQAVLLKYKRKLEPTVVIQNGKLVRSEINIAVA